MANENNLVVCGEKLIILNIETEEQITELSSMKVDYIQGYYYSKPIDKSSFISFIKNNNK